MILQISIVLFMGLFLVILSRMSHLLILKYKHYGNHDISWYAVGMLSSFLDTAYFLLFLVGYSKFLPLSDIFESYFFSSGMALGSVWALLMIGYWYLCEFKLAARFLDFISFVLLCGCQFGQLHLFLIIKATKFGFEITEWGTGLFVFILCLAALHCGYVWYCWYYSEKQIAKDNSSQSQHCAGCVSSYPVFLYWALLSMTIVLVLIVIHCIV